jgi:dipeptidyl aminopeptidase/acylaminoacyl peptidase
MKLLISVFFIIHFVSCQGQTNLLLDKEVILDWSEYPVYSMIIDESAKNQWKNEFKYLDSIELSWITYNSDGLKIKGMMAQPKKDGKHPCIIYNRGGNRDFGALKVDQRSLNLAKLASHGYIVIACQYRGNGGSEGREEFGGKDINDVLNLMDVLREIEEADTTRIGMYGWSRGGMMTYLALAKSNKIKTAIVGGAVSDIHQTIIERPEMEEKVISQLIPDYQTHKKEELDKRSAIKWVNKFPKNKPILMLHGNADQQVNVAQSIQLAAEFDKSNIPYKLKIFEGGDHSLSQYKIEVNDFVLDWFGTYLKHGDTNLDMEAWYKDGNVQLIKQKIQK